MTIGLLFTCSAIYVDAYVDVSLNQSTYQDGESSIGTRIQMALHVATLLLFVSDDKVSKSHELLCESRDMLLVPQRRRQDVQRKE